MKMHLGYKIIIGLVIALFLSISLNYFQWRGLNTERLSYEIKKATLLQELHNDSITINNLTLIIDTTNAHFKKTLKNAKKPIFYLNNKNKSDEQKYYNYINNNDINNRYLLWSEDIKNRRRKEADLDY